jgi:hypothetical protein
MDGKAFSPDMSKSASRKPTGFLATSRTKSAPHPRDWETMQNGPKKNLHGLAVPFNPRSGELKAALERCRAEQAEIEARGPEAPHGWLAALGWADWEAEKHLIEAEQAANQMR